MLRFRHHADGGIAEGTVGSPEELDRFRLAIPVEPPEVWCAGVTYLRSRDARVEESIVKDVYTLVYDAERPELFMKDAGCRRTVRPGEPIGVRADSGWDVPEPEIGVVLGEGGALAGPDDRQRRLLACDRGREPALHRTGEDVCRRVRDRAGDPRSRRLGRAARDPDPDHRPDGAEQFAGETSSAMMRRSFVELVDWLLRDNPVPAGSVLLTGTGLVPPDDFTLEPGHTVEITVPEIGTLTNPVVSATELTTRARSEAHV